MPNHLIANSGLQFICNEMTINPSESPEVENDKQLGYCFIVQNDNGDLIYDFLCQSNQTLVPLRELLHPTPGMDLEVELNPAGRIKYTMAGLPIIKQDANLAQYATIPISSVNKTNVIRFNSLESLQIAPDSLSRETVPAYEMLLDRWLPMPMFEQEQDGSSRLTPTGWCRMKMQLMDVGPSGKKTFRLIWAFDTNLGEVRRDERPSFEQFGPNTKKYSLCNNAENLMEFISAEELDGRELTPAAEYILGLMGVDPTKEIEEKLKHLSYYLYFINVVRLCGAPEIELHHRPEKVIDVDLVLDIGNSRTCGVLFENGSFELGKMLEIRDLSKPWLKYDTSFDMRVALRNADFGSEIRFEDESLFKWNSILRVGEEAKHLMYSARANDGLQELTTNYSSPKRYLWDKQEFAGKWDFLITEDDPINVRSNASVYIKDLTVWFDRSGHFDGQKHPGGDGNKYSRSSLMTFAFVEIFQQAYMYINSVDYREHRGDKDCRRRLRNIIITAPTAMPNAEQVTLRQSAKDALNVLGKIYDYFDNIQVIPDPDGISSEYDSDPELNGPRQWCYDEATASQFVYLYAELNEKYNGEIDKFIEAKGHVRPEDKDAGYDGKSLTIASIDIGAGTTDLMICSYKHQQENSVRIKPVPIFWDSFYLAGDDIIKMIIQQCVIDGNTQSNADYVGSISSILHRKLGKMSDEAIGKMPIVNKSNAFKLLYDNVLNSTPETRDEEIKNLCGNIVANYFGVDAAGMNYKDKICRLDFNTQVSVPIAQFFLEQLRRNRPARLFTFDEIFTDTKPSEYLLEHFENHFGFRLQDIEWRFDPYEISRLVSKTLEPLMRQMSIILNAYKIDILILAGRPASLSAVTDLFIKYYPVSPDRLVRLNSYHVGRFYPLATDRGYFVDQKSVVAVGAMVAHLASTVGCRGLAIDMSELADGMHSTANYIGLYNPDTLKTKSSILTPSTNRVKITIDTFPVFLGCKQLDVKEYHARPLYSIDNYSGYNPLTITLVREDYRYNREELVIEEVEDAYKNSVPVEDLELMPQSLAVVRSANNGAEETSFWMDNGAFKFLDA